MFTDIQIQIKINFYGTLILPCRKWQKKRKIYILWVNFDLLNYANDNDTFKFLNSFVENDLLPLIHQPTRITESSGTVIDNIFCKNFDHETISGNLLIKISDHLPQFATVKKPAECYQAAAKFYKHDYRNFDKDLFLDDFSTQNCINLETGNLDSNEKFNDFLCRVNSCADRHAPIKKMSRKQIKLNLKPSITNKIIKMMHHRDKLFSKWNKSPVNTHIHNAYKKFRNCTRQEIRKSKREYYNNFLETYKANMKQLWSGIKSIITLKPRSQKLISQIRVDNIDYDDHKDIDNQFNKLFINVADDVRKTIPNAPKSHKEYIKAPNSSLSSYILVLQKK